MRGKRANSHFVHFKWGSRVDTPFLKNTLKSQISNWNRGYLAGLSVNRAYMWGICEIWQQCWNRWCRWDTVVSVGGRPAPRARQRWANPTLKVEQSRRDTWLASIRDGYRLVLATGHRDRLVNKPFISTRNPLLFVPFKRIYRPVKGHKARSVRQVY